MHKYIIIPILYSPFYSPFNICRAVFRHAGRILSQWVATLSL